jgi:hypothetical protein
MWYQSTRGTQILTALYTFNCPTFLFTQEIWKVFVENQGRTSIKTFPYGPLAEPLNEFPRVNASKVNYMGPSFLTATRNPSSRSSYTNSYATLKQPPFVSDYNVQGEPIYTQIRVFSLEKVKEIEDEIEAQEKFAGNVKEAMRH